MKDPRAGFTLFEIILVFAIIGLMSTYMLGNSFINAQARARDGQRRAHLKQVAVLLEQYINDHGRYPESSSNGEILACGGTGDAVCEWGEAFTDQNGTVYAAQLPQDPRPNSRTYVYQTSPNGQAWQLFAALEKTDGKDIDRNSDGEYSVEEDGYGFVDCGIGSCSYGVSSGNTTPDEENLSGF